MAYNADGVSTGTPQNASRTVDYTIAPNTLNRQSMTDSLEGVTSYSPNALNQDENVGGGDIYYDDNFNVMWTGGFNAWYDSANRLTWAQSGEDYGQFVYDGLGRCLKRTVNWETTLIAYDGWKPIVEWDEFGYFKAWNIYGPGPDEILWRYENRFGHLRYHLDRMGNVAFLLDANGVGREKYTYDAFGRPTVTDWDGANPRSWSWYGNRFMFTGREYFPELGIYDYRNRFYHPILGRFLQSDPISFGAGDANLFRYCGGDPVNWTDPSGLLSHQSTPSGRPPLPLQSLNGFVIYGDPIPEWDPPNYADGSMLTNAIDWGSFGEIMHYFGGGDHGRTGGGFHGLGDGPLGGGFSLGPALPPSPQLPRSGPDFATVNVNVAIPYTLNLVSLSLTASIDRYGQTYFSPFLGLSVGEGLTFVSANLTVNKLGFQPGPLQPSQLSSFLSQNSFAGGGGVLFGGALTWSPGNGVAYGGGLFTPSYGASYNYSFQGPTTPFGWSTPPGR